MFNMVLSFWIFFFSGL